MSTSGKTAEELRAAARAAGLSQSEQNFVCFDWANCDSWHEYLTNLYPTPPLNKLLKWKKKFYKAHQDSTFDVNSSKVDDFLKGDTSPSPPGPPPSASASGFRPGASACFNRVGNPPSGSVLAVLSPLTLICFMVGVFRQVVAAATGAKDPAGTAALTVALFLRIYCCFGLPPLKLWPLSKLGDSFANEGVLYFQQVVQHDAMHGVMFMVLTGMMPNSLPLIASPMLTSAMIAAQILREKSGLLAFVANIGPVQTFISMCDRKRYQILQLRADLEAYYGLFFVLWAFLKLKFTLIDALIPGYLYWQLQKTRYLTCPYSQATYRRIDGACASFTNHHSCPRIIQKVYSWVRNFCIRQVQPVDQRSGGRSTMCTIM